MLLNGRVEVFTVSELQREGGGFQHLNRFKTSTNLFFIAYTISSAPHKGLWEIESMLENVKSKLEKYFVSFLHITL